MFNFTVYKSQSELLCIAPETKSTEKVYMYIIEFHCLITDDELSFKNEKLFVESVTLKA